MENDEDLAVHEIMGFLRYLRACAEHDAPFDLKAHIPRIESLIKDYDEAVSKENFNSISEGLIDAIATADQPIDPSLKQGRDLRLDIDRKLLASSMGASKDFLEGPTTYSTTRFQVWEKEGAYSVPVQFAEEVAALGKPDCPPIADDLPRVVATVHTAAAVLSAVGGEE